jgi:CHRD domain
MSIRLFLPLTLVLCSAGLFAQTAADPQGGVFGSPTSTTQIAVLQARLNPLEENPPVTNSRTLGTGTVIVRYDRPTTGPKKATFLISIDLTTGEAGTIRIAHIHRGVLGANGPVVIDFALTATPTTAGGNTHIESQFEVTLPATLAIVDEILANPSGFYFNVHSVLNPGGVVRGQLVETDLSAIRRLEARSNADTALIRRLVINMAAKDGLITIAERDTLLAQ